VFEDVREIDPALIASFRANGHVRVPALATREELDAVRDDIWHGATTMAWNGDVPLEDRDTYGKAFLQASHLWKRHPAVARFSLARRFASVAAQLLEVDGVRLYNDQALFKEPGGGHTPWHQDQTYWPLDSDRTITMWMAFDDIRAPQSGLSFADGTHVLGHLGSAGISDDTQAHFDRVIVDRGLSTTTYSELDAGDTTWHAGWTLHSAPGNPTDRMRPAMTVIYVADGVRVAEPEGTHQELDLKLWLKGCAAGDLAAGPNNPLLYTRP
jgi:ectoine hydroxylase-related dioxygenase (phytanoyl-CoA dioxygenase family)